MWTVLRVRLFRGPRDGRTPHSSGFCFQGLYRVLGASIRNQLPPAPRPGEERGLFEMLQSFLCSTSTALRGKYFPRAPPTRGLSGTPARGGGGGDAHLPPSPSSELPQREQKRPEAVVKSTVHGHSVTKRWGTWSRTGEASLSPPSYLGATKGRAGPFSQRLTLKGGFQQKLKRILEGKKHNLRRQSRCQNPTWRWQGDCRCQTRIFFYII